MANQPQQPDTALHNASHLMQYHDLIESIVAALDARDAYTASHSDRVADMVLVLAAALGLDEDETTRIHMAAHLHDIGKIAVPDSVLRKAGPLTRPEWEEMRRHPVTGYEILRKIDDFKEIAILVRHHHERWDGRGYPDGLSGHDIPPGSRVIAVADSIDAMMSSRSYRPAMTSAACRREIEKNSGIMYDPRVAAAALEHWDELVSRYAGADTPRTPYFDRLQLEHTRQAHDYLLTHQGSRITLPELAAKFHLSQSSLKICFKALYGVPVASYLRGLRMDTAARLLQESDLPVAEIPVDAKALEKAMHEKNTSPRPAKVSRPKAPKEGPVEVDLHIHELVDTTAGMNNADMLQLQLQTFRDTLDRYKGEKGRKIIFIHGKGDGVLRRAILEELQRKYKSYEYQDASFREYGFGATQVTIR